MSTDVPRAIINAFFHLSHSIFFCLIHSVCLVLMSSVSDADRHWADRKENIHQYEHINDGTGRTDCCLEIRWQLVCMMYIEFHVTWRAEEMHTCTLSDQLNDRYRTSACLSVSLSIVVSFYSLTTEINCSTTDWIVSLVWHIIDFNDGRIHR
jgi:hypothetical protein